MSVHRLQFHFVRSAFITRSNFRTLAVTVHHKDNGFITGDINDIAPDRFKSEPFTSVFSSVTGNHLIPPVIFFVNGDRSDNTAFADTIHQCLHILIIENSVRVIRKVIDFGNGDVVDLWQFVFLPFLVSHKKLIVSRHSEIYFFRVTQSPVPPS